MWKWQPRIYCLTRSHDYVSSNPFNKAFITYISRSGSAFFDQTLIDTGMGEKNTISHIWSPYPYWFLMTIIVFWIYHGHDMLHQCHNRKKSLLVLSCLMTRLSKLAFLEHLSCPRYDVWDGMFKEVWDLGLELTGERWCEAFGGHT